MVTETGSYWHAVLREVLFRLGYRVHSEVEDRGGEDGIRLAFFQDLHHVVEVSRAAGSDHRDTDRGGNGRRELAIVTCLGAVRVHRGEKDLARAPAPDFLSPLNGVEVDGSAPAVGVDAPFPGSFPLRIDGDDDALAAEGLCARIDERRVVHRRGVDADLVRAGLEHGVHVLHGADPAADSEWDEAFLRRAPHDIDHGLARVGRGGDVQENEFVRLLLVVGDGALDGIARVDEIYEVDSLYDTAVGDVEAGDDSFGEHGGNFNF